MKKIETRSLVAYVCVAVVGLFLLLLVSPSFLGYTTFPLLPCLFAILPLLVIVTLLTLVFGNSKQSTKSYRHKTSRIIGIIAAIGITMSIVLTYVSTRIALTRPGSLKFGLENAGVAALFVAYVFTVILMDRQRFVYWPFWNSKDKSQTDEREKAVRNRVFEKSYRLNVLLVVIVGWLVGSSSKRMHDELIQVGILCLFGLPSILASWQKDS